MTSSEGGTGRGQVWSLPAVLYHDMCNGQHTDQCGGNQRNGDDCKHMSEFISQLLMRIIWKLQCRVTVYSKYAGQF